MSAPRSCCVPFCESIPGQSKELSFHQIPSSLKERTQWLSNISRADSENQNKEWVPSDWAVVCSRHFLHSDFQTSTKRKLLKRSAVPTLFPDYPKYKQPKIVKERRPLQRLNCTNKKLDPLVEVQQQVAATECVPQNLQETETDLLKDQPKESLLIMAFKKRVASLQIQVDDLKEKINSMERRKMQDNDTITRLQGIIDTKFEVKPHPLEKLLTEIEKDANKGGVKACILLQQILAYKNKRFRWSELCLRMCVLWKSKSSKSYNFARAQLVNLPCSSTLQKYIGPSSLETGLTSLAETRLRIELTELNEHEKYCSLIFDEMAILQKLQYNRQADKVIGYAHNLSKNRKNPPLANKLLCFVLKGLSTNYRIPVAYYLVRQLVGTQLHELVKYLLCKLEEIGFRVCRLVCDDASVNRKAYELLCEGNLSHKIPHPIRPSDPLFLSFDPCHVVKNLRNQFIDDERNLNFKGNPVSARPIKSLYENQKNLTVKPIRYLNRKMIYPTNFEKMNVKRAVRIFSTEMIAALELCAQQNLSGFSNIQATLEFMKNVQKWFEIHNICNRSNYRETRNPNKEEFWLVDDERLSWLELDFLKYLDHWKAYAEEFNKSQKVKTKKSTSFLTKETYTALRITTLATVDCIRYLIQNGFHYVLTRKFTSDDIEGIFSAVRSAQGWNDQANAVGSIYALERILKTGLFAPSSVGNTAAFSTDLVETSCLKSNVIFRKMPEGAIIQLTPQQRNLISNFLNNSGNRSLSVRNAGIAMVSGFLVRLVKDKHLCPLSVKLLEGDPEQELNKLIKIQDRGGLCYPSVKLIDLVHLVLDILKESPISQQCDALVKSWVKTLLNVIPVGTLPCGCGDETHEKMIFEIIFKSVCKIYFNNMSNNVTDSFNQKPKFDNNPLSNKVKKL